MMKKNPSRRIPERPQVLKIRKSIEKYKITKKNNKKDTPRRIPEQPPVLKIGKWMEELRNYKEKL